jgi:hypothetical protein
LLGYTPHSRSYRGFNLETNTIVESCDVTFNEIAPSPRGVFECAGDKEMNEIIFVDKELQGFNDDEYESLLSSTSSLKLVPASTLEAEAPRATTSSQQQWRSHRWRGRLSLSRELHFTFIRRIHLNK